MSSHADYQSPLNSLRCHASSAEMRSNFSARKKFLTWRRLWTDLARAQMELGVPNVSQEQVDELTSMQEEEIDFEMAEREERKCKHEIVAHIRAFGAVCPKASPIIHMGASSCFVTDNADLIVIRDGLDILLPKIARCVDRLAGFAERHKDLPTLGYTDYQAAQLTTVGKRACLWISDLLMDERALSRCRKDLRFLGAKGATGTQASFMQLFEDDDDDKERSRKAKLLDEAVARMSGFDKCVLVVCGQSYSRKVDVEIVSDLGALGSTAHKICTDVRLLAHDKELEETFETSHEVGFSSSSAMLSYRRNPVRSERTCSLARHLMTLVSNATQTHAVQWLERSLDDSANRRLTLSEAFLSADAVLQTMQDVFEGIVVNSKAIERNLRAELPFLATENMMLAMVKEGADRQECHERLRILSQQAGCVVKQEGKDNDLVERVRRDPYFAPIVPRLDRLLDPRTFVGRAPEQVVDFLREEVWPMVERYKEKLVGAVEFKL